MPVHTLERSDNSCCRAWSVLYDWCARVETTPDLLTQSAICLDSVSCSVSDICLL